MWEVFKLIQDNGGMPARKFRYNPVSLGRKFDNYYEANDFLEEVAFENSSYMVCFDSIDGPDKDAEDDLMADLDIRGQINHPKMYPYAMIGEEYDEDDSCYYEAVSYYGIAEVK